MCHHHCRRLGCRLRLGCRGRVCNDVACLELLQATFETGCGAAHADDLEDAGDPVAMME